jgi:esterase/lipase superfamily enzyme
MPTPAIYQTDTGRTELFAETPPERRTVELELLYFTDRAPQTTPESALPYGDEDSRSLVFGSVVVTVVPNLTWTELEQQSRRGDRTKDVNLELTEVRERGRFPEEPYELKVTSTGVFRSPTVVAQHRLVRARFESALGEQLRLSPSKEVVLYVHGLNETFATAAYTMADLCHFLGREHVCMLFTWPPTASGSVGHLRKAIRMVGQVPEIKGVHLLAHGRGAAVLLNAVRELTIETIAAGVEPAEALKLTHVVLMAPEVDEDAVGGRRIETFSSDPDMISLWPYDRIPKMLKGRMTIYSSPEERALFVSPALFPGRSSVGQLSPKQMAIESQTKMGKLGKLDFILYKGKRIDFFRRPYFASNPEVASDLIQLLRYHRKPGEPGRPLKKVGPVAWTFVESEASAPRR